MDAKTISLTHGKVKVCVYERADYYGSSIRPTVAYIYKRLPEFNSPITWIVKCIPNEDSSLKDLEELLTEYKEFVKDDELVFTEAGSLMSIPVSGKLSDGVSYISKEKKTLLGLGFANILWNMTMTKSYGNIDTMILMNKLGNEFVDNNIGENKLINRKVTE